jgi:hypothetical protein
MNRIMIFRPPTIASPIAHDNEYNGLHPPPDVYAARGARQGNGNNLEQHAWI